MEQEGNKQILERLEENTRSLHISRVPKKVKRAFIDLANEEFEGDYGFLLMFLMEGVVNRDLIEIRQRIEALEQAMKEKKEESEPTKKVVKMLGGNTVRFGGKRK